MKLNLNPYLFFNGNCEQAFKLYERVLGGKIEMMMPHAGSPAEKDVPPEWRDKIMHAKLTFGDNVLMASDAPPQHAQHPQGFSVNISVPDFSTGERIFRELAEGGAVKQAYGKTFWAEGFGMLVDRFGIPWMVNVEHAAKLEKSA
jgi:PhnB protein